MQLSSWIALAGLLAADVQAYTVDKNAGGVSPAIGSRPDRKEINAFVAAGGPAFDLYMLCVAQIQARPQDKVDSWYQVSGIHGRPYTAWDGVQSGGSAGWGGYCPHSSVLFPTWHRPYLQLLEQNIWQCAQSLAATYPIRQRTSYTRAADSLRLVYWDWAKTAAIPPIVTQQQVTVTNPAGDKIRINNPLYSYQFNTSGPGGPGTSDFPGNDAPQTYRQTARQPNTRGVSDHQAVNRAMENIAEYLHDSVYNILTSTKNYGEFSNNGFAGTQQGAGSLEVPHGAVHNAIGGSRGHMTYLDYSAFDPIFWLHHTNVDRIFAIWQALNPGAWDINQVNNQGSFAIASGTVETAATPLFPFHRTAAGDFWTSDAVRSTASLGYTYPEIRDWQKTPEQNTADVKAAIRALYDPSAQRPTSRRDVGSLYGPGNGTSANGTAYPVTNGTLINPDGKTKSWAVNLEVNKFGVDRSFNIWFFMGQPSANPDDWAFDKTLIGTFAVLRPVRDNLPETLTIFGTIPLTRKIIQAIQDPLETGVSNLNLTDVGPYLRQNLQWRIADTKGVEVQVKDVPSLKCFVTDQEVTPPKTSTDLPEVGKVSVHVNITEGKDGSAKPGDKGTSAQLYGYGTA